MSHRILIVDDSPSIRSSLRSCIERSSDWEICGEAEDGKIAVELVQRLHPDVIVLDLSMPVMNGLEAAREIRKTAPHAYILLFTLHSYPQLVAEARKVGVNDVVSKAGDAGNSVIRAVRSLLAA
jgi:two-component system, NarL family, response regulator YdfI